MNKKIFGVFVGVLAVVMLATPMIGTVVAIGPVKAVDVGKNPKIAEENLPMGVAFLDDVGPNNIMWVNALSLIVSMADARKGSGRMNNAIIANHDTLVDMQINPEMYDNKLVYLSGTGGEQWDNPTDVPDKESHGMLYWNLLPIFGPIAAAELEQEYADGAFIKTNRVGN
jgi:hypothetical protein